MSNQITAYFKGRTGVAEPVYQNDYGMVLNFDGIYLPSNFDCHFSVLGSDTAIPGVGADNRVAIPNTVLSHEGNVTVHIPLHTGSDDSEVEYVVYFKVIGRARPEDDGTPVQMTAIERALALLSQPITNIEEIVNEALSFTGEKFDEMRSDLQGDYDTFTSGVNDDIGDMHEDIAGFKTEIRGNISDVEADFTVLQGQFDTAVAGVTTDTEVTDIRVGADGVTGTTAGASVRRQFTNLQKKMVLCKSDNLSMSDSDWTSGYFMAMNGNTGTASGYAYSPKIPVSEGDIVRCYNTRGGAFGAVGLRFVTAFDATDTAQESKGDNREVSTYTVPDGITSVVLSLKEGTDYCVTLNKTTTTYIPYFETYYIADYDFIEDALADYEVPPVTPKGYNLLPNAKSGSGAYYASGGNPVYVNDSSYNYYIVNAKKNTDYTFCSNFGARFWIVTDDNDNVIKSGAYLGIYLNYINTGDGTKIWLSCPNSDVTITLVEGYLGNRDAMQKPSFLSGVSLLLQSDRYACSLPRHSAEFTQGIDETFYYDNMFSVNRNMLHAEITLGGYPYNVFSEDGVEVNTTNTSSAGNGYRVNIYDFGFNRIDSVFLKPFNIVAKNLQNCSALVIGDSQIEQGVITGDMLDSFSADGKTLTLLGTRGNAPNLTEGRSGWTAKQYCTVASSGTVVNAFWNPSTEKFDFEYYMTQQGYSSVDFVIINLGGNDLYNAGVGDDQKISETAGYIFEIIDSIIAYNSNQKIILNLAPATTHNDAVSNKTSMITRNNYVRYNNMMQVLCRAYVNNVRTSYTHLVVNPETDLADHIHENAGGYKKMADDLINQINCWQNA